jgi:predicted RNA-binding protein with EMAP domain
MSDELDWTFSGPDDAKEQIRGAVRYLLKDAAGSDRGDIVREIIAIVNEVASGLPPGGEDPLDDGMPGG